MEKDLKKYINDFVEHSLEYEKCNPADSSSANKILKKIGENVKEIKKFGNDGIEELYGLYRHSSDAVRCFAASNTIKINTADAISVLTVISVTGTGHIASYAYMILQIWEKNPEMIKD